MFRIEVTEPADRDVNDILHWLKGRSAQGAVNWWNAYLRAVRSLGNSDCSFGVAPESSDLGEEIREIPFKTRYGNTYRIVFIIRTNIVYVLRVRGVGQPRLSQTELEFPN